MTRTASVLLFALAGGGLLAAADGDVVFRSDVSLVRVDAQVVDRDNRAITGLQAGDFVLREEGRPQQIRNFASEDMPVDVMLLLDVSRSMRPHIQRVSSAAHQAFQVLRDQDRVAIMVFDRSTRLRMPFRSSRDEAERELTSLLRHESFDGGTDITRGMLEAADYVARQARPEARRAIVIVTDDRTQRDRDEAAVSRALARADAVLCALIAPDAMHDRSSWPGGGGGRGRRGGGGGGSWPSGSGPTIGGPLGGIIFGRRGPYGGRGGQSGGGRGPGQGSETHSAGTAEIARESGGDSVAVDDASALENTLARIRQRYALHFHLPEDVKPGQERNIAVELAASALRRYPGAEVRYRRVYLAPDRVPVEAGTQPPRNVQRTAAKRRSAVNEPLGAAGATSTIEPPSPATPAPPPEASPAPSQGGWPRVKPDQQP